MPFEEVGTKDSNNWLNVLDDDFARMQSESGSSEEEATDDDIDLQICNKIKSELDAEFQSETTCSKSFEVQTHWSQTRIKRKRCAGCYEQIRKEKSREASNTITRKI